MFDLLCGRRCRLVVASVARDVGGLPGGDLCLLHLLPIIPPPVDGSASGARTVQPGRQSSAFPPPSTSHHRLGLGAILGGAMC